MCVHICVCAYIYVYTHIQSCISRDFQKLHVHLKRSTSTSYPLLHQERRGSKLVSMLNSQSMNTRGGERSMHPKVPPPKGCCPAMALQQQSNTNIHNSNKGYILIYSGVWAFQEKLKIQYFMQFIQVNSDRHCLVRIGGFCLFVLGSGWAVILFYKIWCMFIFFIVLIGVLLYCKS